MNENLLDAIVNNADGHAAPAPAAHANLPGNGHSFAKGDQITSSGVVEARMRSMEPGAYRGMGADIRDAQNNPAEVLKMASMDWKTVPMPLAIKGKSEYREYPNMVALVRSDNGHPLAVATTDYKPHQNIHLVKTMCDFASESGLTLSRVGTFNGGSRGFAVATSGVSREAKVGDVVAMHVILKFGHAPGTATTILAFAHELRCSNGACIVVAQGRARFVHSAELTAAKIKQAHNFVQLCATAFGAHVDKLAMLRQIRSNKGIDLMQLTELFQPELATSISQRLQRITNATAELDQEILGKRVLADLLERDASVAIVSDMVSKHANRLLAKVVEATVRQPGGQMTVGTMAHAYSGVTNYNSNIRGRQADTGLEANLFGTAQQDTQRALRLAVEVAQRVTTL